MKAFGFMSSYLSNISGASKYSLPEVTIVAKWEYVNENDL